MVVGDEGCDVPHIVWKRFERLTFPARLPWRRALGRISKRSRKGATLIVQVKTGPLIWS